jgi:hypothetical protein
VLPIKCPFRVTRWSFFITCHERIFCTLTFRIPNVSLSVPRGGGHTSARKWLECRMGCVTYSRLYCSFQVLWCKIPLFSTSHFIMLFGLSPTTSTVARNCRPGSSTAFNSLYYDPIGTRKRLRNLGIRTKAQKIIPNSTRNLSEPVQYENIDRV